MKIKKIKTFLVTALVAALSITAISCGNTKSTTPTPSGEKPLVKVKLNEVARSVFYAPMYAAINQGFFKEEGLDIDLSTGQGAEATCTERQIKNITFIFLS
ncbi:ABC transporter substrate-binding protein [Clostridium sp. YIM B02505]|uniref:ABC transporter substrate-binding protein n=1 Tax=Clostridium yunnanense TaxID=2800325 RepID=A0ABS1EW41_9CLOT|nr:ABC transporter substrate-binding protein [Clostridium yunnanense]MBK1813609.1 ABC transporter substrate-binding protein [Clostridium yunnanense]